MMKIHSNGINNVDNQVVKGFGYEWSKFDQSNLSNKELLEIFDLYFSIFPWHLLPENPIGFDLGCGSGRWAKIVAPRVGELHCIDPSVKALNVAMRNLIEQQNCIFHLAGVDNIPLEDESSDFGYSLGVLHHIPDTEMGLKACVSKLKKEAPFLLYLYYAFDNKPRWYRFIWKISEIVRFVISRSPYFIKYIITQIMACLIWFSLARFSLILEKLGFNVDSFPLSFYRKRSFYVMRTDTLDFATKIEKRFTKLDIQRMMERCGLRNITFSDHAPYWCAVGYKR
jgi:ubiquinone/menaquinone biosynthesis C-methylase UbiE